MRIAVAGTGYVGFSLAALLSRYHDVAAVDIIPQKIDIINQGRAPFCDNGMEEWLATHSLHLTATLEADKAYSEAELIIVATPTDYSPEKNYFDTSSVESVLHIIRRVNPSATVVIKSTLPLGFTKKAAREIGLPFLLFSPEFLREGMALQDNLHPSRIIVGMSEKSEELQKRAEQFARIMYEACEEDSVQTLIMQSTEAEAVKLFANTYLAMRVAFFNELDTYAEQNELNAGQIIKGVSLDPRIGTHYNNPSFGYGGYCLPKDSKQLLAEYNGVPNSLIKAIVDSNSIRKNFIVSRILDRHPKTAGIYRLIMKSGSDNFRQAAVLDIIDILQKHGVRIIIYEPMYKEESYNGCDVIRNLKSFAEQSDIIIANRQTKELSDYSDKVYTRDKEPQKI